MSNRFFQSIDIRVVQLVMQLFLLICFAVQFYLYGMMLMSIVELRHRVFLLEQRPLGVHIEMELKSNEVVPADDGGAT